jgi:hypothetical protein
MNVNVEDMVSQAGAEVTLERSLSDVMARGNQLRRRQRRRATGLTAVAVTAIAASVLAVGARSAGDRPHTPQPQQRGQARVDLVSFSGGASNLSPTDLAALTATCHDRLTGPKTAGLSVAGAPVAAEMRGDRALAYFSEGDVSAFCSATKSTDGSFEQGASWITNSPLRLGSDDLAVYSLGLTYNVAGMMPEPGVPATDIFGVAEASDRVATARVTVGGSSYEAAVSNGVVLMWLPDGLDSAQVEDATLTAFAADGTELATTRPNRS